MRGLAAKLRAAQASPRVTVMPDFFLDRIVSYGSRLEDFLADVGRVARQGGGSLGFRRQRVMRGGNAANTASALAMLGARVTLIVRTSPLGLKLLEHFMPSGVDLSRVKCDGELSMTVSIELPVDGRLCNVMISDPGSLADYGPERLSEGDYEAIASSDYVCVFNWASNRRGTELAEEVFRVAKECGRARTFMDTADPSQRAPEIPELVRRVFRSDLLDALGVNENEARWYAKYAAGVEHDDPLKCAEAIHRELGLRVDLHTVDYSACFEGGRAYVAPAFKVDPIIATGAGDAWNAGNIYGWSMGLEAQGRLVVANAVAGLYVSTGRHPSRGEVASFIESGELKGPTIRVEA